MARVDKQVENFPLVSSLLTRAHMYTITLKLFPIKRDCLFPSRRCLLQAKLVHHGLVKRYRTCCCCCCWRCRGCCCWWRQCHCLLLWCYSIGNHALALLLPMVRLSALVLDFQALGANLKAVHLRDGFLRCDWRVETDKT